MTLIGLEVLLLAGVLGVSACTADTSNTPQISPDAVSTPTFTGPWAYEYKSAFNQAGNFPNIKEILFDEEITADEMRGVADEFKSCILAGGAAHADVTLSGEITLLYPQDADDQAKRAMDSHASQCESTTGWSLIAQLFAQSRSNPDREDWNTLMAGCLVHMGTRPEKYTAEDYRTDRNIGGEGGMTIEWLTWSACLSDPRTTLPLFEIQAQCLVRVGVREQDYTAADFEREYYTQVLPEWPEPIGPESAILACYVDPFYAR